MKKIFVLLVVTCFAIFTSAQVKNPVKWEFSAKKLSAMSYEVHLKAKIDKGWHLYSQTTPEGGPVATTFSFNKNPLLSVTGTIKEDGKMERHFEKLFDVEVKQFSGKVDFVMIVNLKATAKTSLTGSVEFMTCNDHECLPPRTEKFSIALK